MNLNKILIGGSRFREFAGSEVTILELAEEFSARGCEVSIASHEFGGEITSIAKNNGFKLIDLSTTNLGGEEYDLAWIHHPPTYYSLFANGKVPAKFVIYSSLSHYEPLESPPIQLGPIHKRLVNSEENLLYSQKHYPEWATEFELFPNAAPKPFWSDYSPSTTENPSTIAIVSNHPPEEILRAAEILKMNSLNVAIFGSAWTPTRITPALLDSYSAVITIGKTVQYCLARCVPIYCYDRFGGPGWIVPDNIDSAGAKNFSGRCTATRRSAESIAKDIVAKYAEAACQSADLRAYASKRYQLDSNIDKVLATLDRKDKHSNSALSITTVTNIMQRHNAALMRERNCLLETHSHLMDCETQIKAIKTSRSWKLTAPLRYIHQRLLQS